MKNDLDTYDIEVSLVDHTENAEETVIRAARNCYLPEPIAGTGDLDDVLGSTSKRELFEHLLGRGHFGPFEQSHATFHIVGASRVTMAQLTRHRHATFDIQSFRYTSPDLDLIESIMAGDKPLKTIDKYAVVPQIAYEIDELDPDWWRQTYLNQFWMYTMAVRRANAAGLPEGRAKEDARYLLPKATRVNIMFTVNARMLMHIADMRAAGDAQWEIRLITEQILEHASDVWPVMMEIYEDELKNRKNRLAP